LQGSLKVTTDSRTELWRVTSQLGIQESAYLLEVQMSAASVIERAQLRPGVAPNEGVGVQRPRQLHTAEKVKLQRTSDNLTEPQFLAALGRMTQFVVHDFRHHLCAVYANAEFMCSKGNNLADREELFDEMKAAMVYMTEQLDALLFLSRTGSMFHLRREPLRPIVEQAIRMVRSHSDTIQVNIISEDMPFVEGHVDGKWLRSAIFSLLLNACQAAILGPKRKEVGVALHQDLTHVGIRITDSGPGVPRSIQKILFQPFVSADRRGRMGLGLAIAECIAREHGGEVYLEESRPGRTSFVLRLPNPAL
jgi:signal transduction histidine kinase